MRIKKFMAAVLAGSMAASAMFCTSVFQASAEDEQVLTFDIRSAGGNNVTISAEDIAAGDVTVPVNIYIPENPGVSGIQLKLQVNDGQVAEDGSFGNYGLYMEDAALADPCCFTLGDSEAFPNSFITASKMNLTWSTGLSNENGTAAAEEGTSAWDSSASWAYSNAFVTANLVVPKDTPAGEYKLDIRRDRFVNALSSSGSVYGKSLCTSADSTEELSFDSIPLTVKVDKPAGEETWQDSYEIADKGHYIIISDVCGAPGEQVEVPVYVYNDQGTAGLQLFFSYDQRLKLDNYIDPVDNYAYLVEPEASPDAYPASFVFGGATLMTAPNGSILTSMVFTIPEDAEEGTVYDVGFYQGTEYPQKLVDRNSHYLTLDLFGGSITVVKDNKTAINRTSVNFTEAGETANLTLFNATGDVTWTSADETVAKVDKNGFVTAIGDGSTTITASNNGTDYTCAVKVGGLFGDVDGNGKISSNDAQITLICYAEMLSDNPPTLTDAQLAIADVSGDGQVSSKDAQQILTYFLEVEVNGDDEVTWYDITKNPNAPGAP